MTIGKSLTLRSAAGFRASLGGVIVAASSGTLDVTVKDIDFSGIVDVRIQGGTGHHVAFRHVSNHTTSQHGSSPSTPSFPRPWRS